MPSLWSPPLHLLCLALAALPVAAVDPGDVITSNLVLTSDLILDEAGDGLVVGANGITIDGNGFRLICNAPMSLEEASIGSKTIAGIRLRGYKNLVIKNFAEIRGFHAGIEHDGVATATIDNCTFIGCGRAVWVFRGHATVRNCTIRKAFTAIEVGNFASNCTFIDNLITDSLWSIQYAQSTGGTATGNEILWCADRDGELGTANIPSYAGMLAEEARPTRIALGETAQFAFRLRTPRAQAAANATTTVTVFPEQALSIDRDGNLLQVAFTPTRSGLHSLQVEVVDGNGNRCLRRWPLQVGPGALREIDCILRHDGPFYGQIPDRWDTGSMNFSGAGDVEDVFCGGWTQFSPNDLPPTPVAILESSRAEGLWGFKPDPLDLFDNHFGLERMCTFGAKANVIGDIPEDFGITAFPYFFTWGAFDLAPVDWAMDERHTWHGLAFKVVGRFPQIRCGKADELSKISFTYRVPTTPEVTAIDQPSLRLLAASASGDSTEIILDGSAAATTLSLVDWPQAFASGQGRIDAAMQELQLAAVDGLTSLTAVPLWLTPPSGGAVSYKVQAWPAGLSGERRILLEGDGTAGSTQLRTRGLAANTVFQWRDGGVVLAAGSSDAAGELLLSVAAPTTATELHLQPAGGGGNQPPVISSLSADPTPVTAQTSQVSAIASDPDAGQTLQYTWSCTSKPVGAAEPQFSPNGTAAASTSTASFFTAGDYTLQLSVSDGAGGSASQTLDLTVAQTASQLQLD